MKLFKFILSFSVIFLICITIQSQSIDDLLKTAKENNLELKIIQNEHSAMLEKAPQVSQLPQPEFGVGAFPPNSYAHSGKRLIHLNGIQRFPWFGLLNQKREVVLAEAKSHFEQLRISQLNLSYEIKNSYFKLYEIQKTQDILQQHIFILGGREKVAISKVESGEASTVNVLKIQLEVAELEQQIKILETKKIQPVAQINQILNRPINTPIDIEQELEIAILPSQKDALIQDIRTNHPLLEMYMLQQQISKEKLKLNQLENSPSFGVGFDYMIVNKFPNVIFDGNGRDMFELKVMATLPIYRKKFFAKKREENFNISVYEKMMEDAFSKFAKTIEIEYANHETAMLQIELFQKQKMITQSAIRVLESEYSSKGTQFDELLKLEKQLLEYDLKILKAIVQSHIAVATIERFIVQ